MRNDFYVYFHINPLTNKVFYIGKGNGKRAFNKKKRNIHWQRTVKKYGYIIDIAHENLTEEKAFELECQYIMWFGLKNLCNITKGGNGGDTISNNPNRAEIIHKQKKYATENRVLLSVRAKEAWTKEFRENQIEKQSKKHLMALDLETGFVVFADSSKQMAEILRVKHSLVRTAKCYGWNVKRRYVIFND